MMTFSSPKTFPAVLSRTAPPIEIHLASVLVLIHAVTIKYEAVSRNEDA
jgi:hypothetical protein